MVLGLQRQNRNLLIPTLNTSLIKQPLIFIRGCFIFQGIAYIKIADNKDNNTLNLYQQSVRRT